MTHQFI